MAGRRRRDDRWRVRRAQAASAPASSAPPRTVAAAATPAPAPTPTRDLTPAERRWVDRMLEFMQQTDSKMQAQARRFNGSAEVETLDLKQPAAEYLVHVTRGPVLEKAGYFSFTPLQGKGPAVPDPLWSRYVELNLHAATPFVGMLHATLYFMIPKSGGSLLALYMDYLPAVVMPADIAAMKGAVERVYAGHGVDIAPFRAALCEAGPAAKLHRDKLQAACVGTSHYAPPFMPVTDANLDLVTGAFTALADQYYLALERHRRRAATPAETRQLDAMRRRWLDEQMFTAMASQQMVPYEVWSLGNMPPTVRF